jgi:hypothetical protein
LIESPSSFSALNVTVVDFDPTGSKSGTGSKSFSLVTEALTPMPPCAYPSHISFWFAPPNRIRSADSAASRAWSMVGFTGISSIASNTSCIQRRLPGHRCAGVMPSAHSVWSSWSSAG